MVVKAYLAQVLRAARGAGLDETRAEDVTQATFATFIEKASSFDGRSHVRTWLFGILYKKILEIRREIKRDTEADDISDVVEQRFKTDGSWLHPPKAIDAELHRSQIGEWISIGLEALSRAALDPFDVLPARSEDRTGSPTDEAVAGPLFRTLGGFEEEARLAVVETLKERERGIQISADLAHDGDQISAGRELLERISGGAVQLGLSANAAKRRVLKKRCKNALLPNALGAVKEAELIEAALRGAGRIISEADDPVEEPELEPELAILSGLEPQRPAVALAEVFDPDPIREQYGLLERIRDLITTGPVRRELVPQTEARLIDAVEIVLEIVEPVVRETEVLEETRNMPEIPIPGCD